MYIVTFPSFTAQERVDVDHAIAWIWAFRAFYAQDVDQFGRPRPLVPLGDAPDRLEAIQNAVSFFEASKDEVQPGHFGLRAAGYEAHLTDGAYTILVEAIRNFAAKWAGPQDAHDLQRVLTFWKGQERLTLEQYRSRLSANGDQAGGDG